MLVEQFERLSGTVVPFAVDVSGIAADPFQMRLQQSCDVGLVHLRLGRQRRLRMGLVGRERSERSGIRLRSFLLLACFLLGALGLLDLSLGVRSGLSLRLHHFLPRSLSLLLGK